MKAFNILVINILLLGGLSLSTCNAARANNVPSSKKVSAISEEIKRNISFPDELLNLNIQESVKVEFLIKDDNSIQIISVSSKNNFLKSYVERKLLSMDLSKYNEFKNNILEITLLFDNQKY